ncbi:MAG: SAM-dependent DNA methyltransferase [Endomicrobia bacterium]|nr:SAM-dependent DNA methyltransferase [Endomicrobiia bacterium]
MKENSALSAFFTPLKWTKWVITEFGIFKKWLEGANICDPTAGTGNFLEAFIETAFENNIKITKKLLKQLYGIEKEKKFIDVFFKKVEKKYKIIFPKENFINTDIILFNPKIKVDILVGNPPWRNFVDLPEDYKRKIKPYFYKYDLVDDTKKLLLGSSRIDIAALVLSIVIVDNLKENGEGYFYIPLSLFFNDTAHSGFRNYKIKKTTFKIQTIYDFGKHKIFENISTKHGLVHIKKNQTNTFPIEYKIKENEKWKIKYAAPLYYSNAPLSIFSNKNELSYLKNLPKIKIKKISKPRQGINTCGANCVFIFDTNKIPEFIPKSFLYPLITKQNFFEKNPKPYKFIFLPYNKKTAKPLKELELKKYPKLWKYLLKHKSILLNRKGILINNWIKRGYWWALLGVGIYSFSPYKVFWQSYGEKNFFPKLFRPYKLKPWQANQALFAYMPFSVEKEAKKVLAKLSNPSIQKFLMSFNMAGTCNWAQPGRIKTLMEFLP